MNEFNGLGMSMGNLARLSKAKTRSISAENPTGAKGTGAMAEADPQGASRELGRGWKCAPFIMIAPGQTAVLAEIEGPGAVQSMWLGGNVNRDFILRIYWDDQDIPSVECPLPDFFASPWASQSAQRTAGPFAPVNSMPVSVNPNRGLNCFWEMPFRKRCRITMENISPNSAGECFYQINYTLTDVPDDTAYFHAQFRRVNPVPYGQAYTILDGVRGWGQYAGTVMGWSINNNGWWGEGEIKSTWTAIPSSRPSAAREPRTTSAARTTGRSMASMLPTPRRSSGCTRRFGRTGPIGLNSATRCTAGT